MARKTQIELVDDIDGSPATQTVGFAVDGVSYEIDLNDLNAGSLREAVGRWVDRGRRVGGRRSGRSQPNTVPGDSPKTGRQDLAAVREWANTNGHTVSNRGRVPQVVLEAYDAAN